MGGGPTNGAPPSAPGRPDVSLSLCCAAGWRPGHHNDPSPEGREDPDRLSFPAEVIPEPPFAHPSPLPGILLTRAICAFSTKNTPVPVRHVPPPTPQSWSGRHHGVGSQGVAWRRSGIGGRYGCPTGLFDRFPEALAVLVTLLRPPRRAPRVGGGRWEGKAETPARPLL